MGSADAYEVSVKFGSTPTTTLIVPPVSEAAEFDQFEDLTSKLLTVPKSELDEKVKES